MDATQSYDTRARYSTSYCDTYNAPYTCSANASQTDTHQADSCQDGQTNAGQADTSQDSQANTAIADTQDGLNDTTGQTNAAQAGQANGSKNSQADAG